MTGADKSARESCLHCQISVLIENWIAAGKATPERAFEQTVEALAEFIAAMHGRETRRRALKIAADNLPRLTREIVALRIAGGLPTGDHDRVGHA